MSATINFDCLYTISPISSIKAAIILFIFVLVFSFLCYLIFYSQVFCFVCSFPFSPSSVISSALRPAPSMRVQRTTNKIQIQQNGWQEFLSSFIYLQQTVNNIFLYNFSFVSFDDYLHTNTAFPLTSHLVLPHTGDAAVVLGLGWAKYRDGGISRHFTVNNAVKDGANTIHSSSVGVCVLVKLEARQRK